MCYFWRQECGWNTTHTYGFNAAWKRDPGTFAFPYYHEYWGLSGNTAGITTVAEASEGGGASTTDQHRLDLSEMNSFHQVEASDASFSSFLTDLSKVLDNLKYWVISY